MMKKAVPFVTPESVSSRRSSLGKIDFDANDQFLSDIVTKLKFTPVSTYSPVPQIVVQDSSLGSFTKNSNTPHDFKFSDWKFTRRGSAGSETSLNFNSLSNRRASCGPIFQHWRSPDDVKKICDFEYTTNEDFVSWIPKYNSLSPNILNGVSNRGFDSKNINDCISPTLKPVCLTFRKLSKDSSDSQLSWKTPTLSPCLEDVQPKNAFHFEAEKSKPDPCKFSESIHPRRKSFHTPSNALFTQKKNSIDGASIRRRRTAGNISKTSPRKKSASFYNIQKPKNLLNLLLTKSALRGDILGRGGFGTVRVGFWKGRKVAIKTIKGKKLSSLKYEKNVLGIEAHSNLVHMHQIYLSDSKSEFSDGVYPASPQKGESGRRATLPSLFGFRNLKVGLNSSAVRGTFGADYYCTPKMMKTAWIVSELCSDVTLLTLINSEEIIWTLREKIRILQEISSGLNYLHSKRLVHLDVKPSNCFFTMSGTAKLGDFGCCSKIGETPNQVLGTMVYQAPEVLQGKPITEKSDIYSLSITAWHLLTLESPYSGLHPHVIIYKVTSLAYRPENSHLRAYQNVRKNSDSGFLLKFLLLKIIRQCWKQEPEERPAATVVRRILSALYFSHASD